MKCGLCIHERLVGKPVSVIRTTLRTAGEAVTIADGVAVCVDHFAQRLLQHQRNGEERQRVELTRRAQAQLKQDAQRDAAPVSEPVA